jgi:hypothetical protein
VIKHAFGINARDDLLCKFIETASNAPDVHIVRSLEEEPENLNDDF